MIWPARLIAGLALAAPMSAWAQSLGQADDPGIAWWRMLAALILCLGLGVGGALALRARLGLQAPAWPPGLALGRSLGLTPAAPRRLRLVETLRVSPQVSVCLVSCDGAEFIVTVSPQGAAITPAPRPETA